MLANPPAPESYVFLDRVTLHSKVEYYEWLNGQAATRITLLSNCKMAKTICAALAELCEYFGLDAFIAARLIGIL